MSTWKLEWNDKFRIENVVVVPAIAEYENIKRLLFLISKNDSKYLKKTLVIFVVNNLPSSTDDVKNDNKKSIDFLCSLLKSAPLELENNLPLQKAVQIGLVDASSEGKELNEKTGGVGLARKIGMDLGLTAFDYNSHKKKIITSLDADCEVEKNYLSVINNSFNELNLNVATIEFSHRADSHSELETISKYEIFLRHYVIGLFLAQSHFTYHTIGSAFVCDIDAYIKAGGMNTRRAAEDFYFLQKLAKVYSIFKINSTVVRPSARQSWRVPFGTGKSVTQLQNGERQFLLYDPQVFLVLKKWNELFYSNDSLNTELLLNKAKSIHTELYNFLIQKDFLTQWEKILGGSNSERQLGYQRKNYFDAFTTLKLVHHLRDYAFPMKRIEPALNELFKLLNYDFSGDEGFQTAENKLQNYLNALIQIENSFSNSHKERSRLVQTK
ncbi:MAG: hypothetical protein HKP17_05660 [Ignavibacteriaceae bacterium]|nr:hypothetical protein [Ignavibacteria bacterium]MBT8393142.1 hypothetical protein [Ignavibacteria bacterium]NNJ52636.1 hypothetical protein [Ignavibacteriaceae bacterium]NNL21138.1 hypothetical protein [Ignavibacteriaceae bacterium]